MEALAPSSLLAISHASTRPLRGSPARICAARGLTGFHRGRPPLRLRVSTASDSIGHLDSQRDSDPVEVIGIGSRKDAVIDFCLSSPSVSSSRLRFWTIHMRDNLKVQLLQRCHGTDMILRNVEFPPSLHPCPPAVILVATAGHGLDHITAIELLHAVKLAGGLTVAIILKPFNFEGQRRQEEVFELINKLQEFSHFQIVVEADSLLEKEIQTLAEALERANNAVFLAISAISNLMSETHLKFRNSPDGEIKEVKPLEVVKLLESYGEAKVGFGAGYNIKSAITQAVFHCPFLNGGPKDLNGPVIFTLASGSALDESDLLSIVLTFRQITECKREIIFSRIHEPSMEPNLFLITLLIVGCNQKIVSQKRSFLSSLALRIPFLSSLLGRDIPELVENLPVHSRNPAADVFISPDMATMSNLDLSNGSLDTFSEEIETELSSKDSNSERLRDGVESLESSNESIYENGNQINEDIRRKQPNSWNIGPAFHMAQLWARQRAVLIGTNKIDEPDTLTLPVGVKSFEQCSACSSDFALSETLHDHGTGGDFLGAQNAQSRDAFADAGLEAVFDIYNSVLTLLKGRNRDESRKRGLLSARAASMLEAEREPQKSFAPVMEIQYRGGIYRGRGQGGLPEGKGRLTFADGSFYDGIWRYGKRCGLGTLCYSNGDVFQGAWRDDLMHGKGWFYFHTGDRWFANFWKGKANGEGRFYSRNGSIFFGHFKNGWRHGQCLYIDIDGSRWTEMWDEGVLVSRTLLEKEASGQ
ncbi:protein ACCUMULATION AND REPLICATION OF CHLOROPLASTS 3 isoform X1 [Phoenix dactylifera]|uniref:Protein ACCUMULATION AND REPLICATION OF CHLOROPLASTS 3 isoform X1 n=1 Tax=Phoenix dactylifera TaxID=42345 RepID=A0A8B7CQP7_PHODC|nr:protein ACCUMULATION AND REPLICATION OF CHLOROPLASTS 3 isoform X1 [Phoenix dactylifera]